MCVLGVQHQSEGLHGVHGSLIVRGRARGGGQGTRLLHGVQRHLIGLVHGGKSTLIAWGHEEVVWHILVLMDLPIWVFIRTVQREFVVRGGLYGGKVLVGLRRSGAVALAGRKDHIFINIMVLSVRAGH